MDRSSRPSLTRAEMRWKAFTSRIFFVMETSRMMFCRLILAERGQKSIKSDRRSFLESSRQVPGACLHQSSINRGNQYATWTVCRACGARLSYSSRKGATSKAKAKARGRATVNEGYPTEEGTAPAAPQRNTPARSSHEEAAMNPALTDLSTAIQAMSVGFQQMSSAMRDLAQGQSRMLQIMTHAQAIPASDMNLNDLSSAAQVMVKENMDVDEELIEDYSPGELVSGESSQPQPRQLSGPPGLMWPRWMTLSALSLASTLTPWAHLSEAGKNMLLSYGGGPGSWVVHHPLPPGQDWTAESSKDLPGHLQVPWVSDRREGSFLPQAVPVWHEVSDHLGQVLLRGPGPLPDTRRDGRPPGAQERVWFLPRHLRLLETHREAENPVIGFSGHGSSCVSGPFWLVSAPTLDVWVQDEQAEAPETRVREDDERGIKWSLLTHLRQGKRQNHHHQAAYDFAELISSTPSLDAARQAGLRVPPAHERFTEDSGWDVFRKDHRRRFREFHTRCRPSFLSIGPQEIAGTSHEEEVRAKVEADFVLEAIDNQIEMGGFFRLRASPDSQVWGTSRWKDFASQNKSVRICYVKENEDQVYQVATNSQWIADASNEDAPRGIEEALEENGVFHSGDTGPPLDVLDTEQLAQNLYEHRDFSRQACLRLLRSTQRDGRSKSRKDSLVQSGTLKYDVYGQYTHGGMSGVTSRTPRSPQFSRYINEFLTRHGATGPRSSFAVTSGARLAYHRDVHNIGLNYVINLGDFAGGQVWVEEEGGPDIRQVAPGKWVPGRLHSPRQHVLGFSPRKYHGPEPWQGERWSLVAYQTRSAKRLSSAQRRELRGFGFDVRGYQVQGGCDHYTTQALILDSAGVSQEPLPVYAQIISGEDEDREDDDDQPEDQRKQTQPSALRPLRQSPPSTVEPTVSEAQAALVKKLHNNCGHPPVDRFLRTLKAAGALPHVLRYVRDQFHCQDCEARRGPVPRRKAQCPRLFTFNRVVSIDTFYIRFQNASVPVLNMVCSGTNYQVVQRLDGNSDGTPTSATTWQAFLTTWVRFLGAPQMIICDGGSEFRGQFERGLEQLGILQHVTTPECPWQNSKSERHGGWLKERLQREVNSGQCSFSSLEEMDEFLASITAAKNRWFNQGGYTPVQLVFGELPRVPAELLSEDQGGLVPLCDAYHDPAGLDECGAEFRRRVQIREKARQAAMEQCSKEALVRATRSSSSQSPAWRSGQWVYVFRRGRSADPLAPKSRWVGPGLVLLNSRGVVWVAMRSRLWRCAPEQLRAAFPTEVLGHQLSSDGSLGELLRQVSSGGQARALDVSREGPPGEDDLLRPVAREEDGVRLSGPLPPIAHGESPQAPRAVQPIPEGLIPVPSPRLHEHMPRTSAPSSRRSSMTVEEPALEPETIGSQQQARESPAPRLPPVEESPLEEDEAGDGPATKVPRTHENGPPEQEASASETRAPGTPVGQLMRLVRREGPASSLTRASSPLGSRDRERSPRRAEQPGEDGDAELLSYDEEAGAYVFLAKRNDEINLKDLSAKEKELFSQSDELEWNSILKTKAVRVVTGKEADYVRERYGDRIVSSRMVRRRKPLEKLGAWKAKSRWCLHGHGDPDTGSLVTYAPTPQVESIMTFLQVGANLKHRFAFCDVKNAFCQSDKLRRPNGPLFAHPCEGLPLPPGALIEIVVPVYGLDDAPAAWRATITGLHHSTSPAVRLRQEPDRTVLVHEV